MSPTRLQFKSDILNIFAGRDQALAGLIMPLTTTSGGSTTAVNDTLLARGTTNANRYDRRMVEIVESVGGGPAIGEVAAVDDAGFDNTDTLTVSPAFTNTVQDGTDFNLYPEGLTPEQLNEWINRVMRNTDVPYIWAPSLVNDAEFENNAIGTDWPDVSSPSVKTFTTTASVPSNLFLGERSLRVLANSVGDGTESLSFHVTERENLLISCIVRADVDAVTVTLRNATGAGADLRSATVNEELFTEVRFQDTVVAGMEEARIRFTSTTTTGDFYISPPVIVQTLSSRAYPAPSWLVDWESQVLEAWYLPQGWSSENADTFVALSRKFRTAPMPTPLRADRWLTRMRVELHADSRGPIVLACLRPLEELTSDTATSSADRQYIAHKVVANVMRERGDGGWRQWARSAGKRGALLHYGDKTPMWSEGPLVRI